MYMVPMLRTTSDMAHLVDTIKLEQEAVRLLAPICCPPCGPLAVHANGLAILLRGDGFTGMDRRPQPDKHPDIALWHLAASWAQ